MIATKAFRRITIALVAELQIAVCLSLSERKIAYNYQNTVTRYSGDTDKTVAIDAV